MDRLKKNQAEKMRVCSYCLQAIQSREGRQAAELHYYDDEDETAVCDWCGEWDNELYTI